MGIGMIRLFKHLGLALVVLLGSMQLASAVDVNTADAAALDSVKDIGPKTAAKIIDERNKNGPFKDWDDLVTRVKGVGPKNSDTMSAGGLTVNGKAKPNAPAAMAAPSKSAASAAPAPTPAPTASKSEPAATATTDSKTAKASKESGSGAASDDAKPAKHHKSKKDKETADKDKAAGNDSKAGSDAKEASAKDAGADSKDAKKKKKKKSKTDAKKDADAVSGDSTAVKDAPPAK